MKRATYLFVPCLFAMFGLQVPTATAAVTEEQVQALLQRIEAQERRIVELENLVKGQATAVPQEPAVAAARPPAPVPAVKEAEKAAPASWTEKVSVQGDLRYRYENTDAEAADSDRNRQRIRARAAIIAKPQENLELGFGLSTSENGDPISSNQTIGNGGSRKDVYVELAYFNWRALDGLAISGGKFRNFLRRPGNHALLWDSDWNPEGFGATWSNGPFFGSVLGSWLESDSNDTEEFTWGDQVGASVPLGAGGGVRLTGGFGYFSFNTAGKGSFYGGDTNFYGNSFDPVTNEFLFDYEEIEAFAELGFNVASLPVSIFADFVRNTDADELDTGWAAGFQVGAAKLKGSWELSYAYQDLEADAVFGGLTDADFGGGGTDNRGHVVRGAYAVSDKWNLAFAWFMTRVDENLGVESDWERLQLDVNFKY